MLTISCGNEITPSLWGKHETCSRPRKKSSPGQGGPYRTKTISTLKGISQTRYKSTFRGLVEFICAAAYLNDQT